MQSAQPHHIYAAFEAVARRRPQHTAVIYLGTRFSYARLHQMAENLAAALAAQGVTPGQRVIIYLPNSIQWVTAWLGIQRAGGVCVPITPIYTPHDLDYIANDSRAEAIICADTNFGYVQQVLGDTRLKQVVVARMADLLPWWKRAFGYLYDVIPKGKVSFDTALDMKKLVRQPPAAAPAPLPGDGQSVAEILYTGGTTKFPKGVPITHDLFLVSADEQIRVSHGLVPVTENVILGSAPLFHILGQTCSLATLLVGGSLPGNPAGGGQPAADAQDQPGRGL
jgi:long-chain acyl-CoA synthetase